MNFDNLPPLYIGLIALLVIWGAVWKGFALYRAARAGDKAWFFTIFVLNTAGILEILYLFVFSKRKAQKSS